MSTWIATPLAALATVAALLLTAPADTSVGAPEGVRLASLQANVMSDACLLTSDAAGQRCATPMASAAVEPHVDALVWPGDFIALTFEAAHMVWSGVLSAVGALYAFVVSLGTSVA